MHREIFLYRKGKITSVVLGNVEWCTLVWHLHLQGVSGGWGTRNSVGFGCLGSRVYWWVLKLYHCSIVLPIKNGNSEGCPKLCLKGMYGKVDFT